MLSPCDGEIISIKQDDEKKIMALNISRLKHYGIRMPFTGTISNYYETKEKVFTLGRFIVYKYNSSLELRSEELGKVHLLFSGIGSLKRAKIWVRSGDNATLGAYLGYLPFGGKVVIEFAKELNILIKEKDSLLSAETLLISKGKDNV